MNWFKYSHNNDFITRVKKVLKTHAFTVSLVEYYHIPIQDIDDNLHIEVADLNGKFAEGNGKIIRIDKKLLNADFFNDNFHFIIHEFFHWIKRRSEEKFYFNDPEEIQSFVLQMTWDLINGKNKEEVISNIHPIVRTHFKDGNKFKRVFDEMVDRAMGLADIYNREQKIIF